MRSSQSNQKRDNPKIKINKVTRVSQEKDPTKKKNAKLKNKTVDSGTLCRSGGTSLQHQQHTLSATRKSPSGPGQISLDVGPRTCNVTCIKHLAMLFHDPPELNSSRSINSCDRSAHSGSRTTHGYSGP